MSTKQLTLPHTDSPDPRQTPENRALEQWLIQGIRVRKAPPEPKQKKEVTTP